MNELILITMYWNEVPLFYKRTPTAFTFVTESRQATVFKTVHQPKLIVEMIIDNLNLIEQDITIAIEPVTNFEPSYPI